MTGIEGVGRPALPRVAGRSPARPRGFAVSPDTRVGDHAAAEPVHATSLASMLALQELSDGTVQDREARRHGHDMLAALQALQRQLLTAADPSVALQRLEELAGGVPLAADPHTAALVSAILVRVRVELARRRTSA